MQRGIVTIYAQPRGSGYQVTRAGAGAGGCPEIPHCMCSPESIKVDRYNLIVYPILVSQW
jgi:hypothetical protein